MTRLQEAVVVASVVCANLLAPGAAWPDTIAWPDDATSRLEAVALVQTLNGEILAGRSATLVLERWCGEHRLADGAAAKIVARRVRDEAKPATLEQRQRLEVGPDEAIKYRHVLLLCGDRVLSEADNWYVPSRLTPEMNRLLDSTDTPFGKAVLDLKPYRQTFRTRVLWWPLGEGWESSPVLPATGGSAMAIPEILFEHEALLYSAEHRPFSEVHEAYRRELLAFPLPHPPPR